MATLTRVEKDGNTRTVIRVLPAKEVDGLIAEYHKVEEARKLEKAKQEKEREAAATSAAEADKTS